MLGQAQGKNGVFWGKFGCFWGKFFESPATNKKIQHFKKTKKKLKKVLTKKNSSSIISINQSKRGDKMKRKLRKASAGSESLILTIPRSIIELLNLNANSEVDVELKGKKIVITTNN